MEIILWWVCMGALAVMGALILAVAVAEPLANVRHYIARKARS